MQQITVGDDAPDFSLPGDGDEAISLSAFRGSIVVLFMYPKADTPGCTTEAVDFSRLKAEFNAIGAVLIGLSPDTARKLRNFRAKHKLDVLLASDVERRVVERYGVWVEKMLYGRQYMGVERTTFLVDRSGRIARIWNKVRVPGHAAEVLDAAGALG